MLMNFSRTGQIDFSLHAIFVYMRGLTEKRSPCNVSYACTTSDMNIGLWRAMVASEPSAVVRLMLEMAGWTMNFSSFSKAVFPSSHSTSDS